MSALLAEIFVFVAFLLRLNDKKKRGVLSKSIWFRRFSRVISITDKTDESVTCINGSRISAIAFSAIETFSWAICSDNINCNEAVSFEAGWLNVLASSTNWDRIRLASVLLRSSVWLHTDDKILSTFRPDVNNSIELLCSCSFPWSPRYICSNIIWCGRERKER